MSHGTRIPDLRDFLPNSKEALAGWKKLSPGSMRLPAPEEFVFDLALGIGQSLPKMMALVRLQFDCYLRPSEALALTKDRLIQPAGPRYPRWGIVVSLSQLAERPKSGSTDERQSLCRRHRRSQVDGFSHVGCFLHPPTQPFWRHHSE